MLLAKDMKIIVKKKLDAQEVKSGRI